MKKLNLRIKKMAYMNQQKKSEIAKLLKQELKKFDVKLKYSLSVKHHSAIVCTISESSVNFLNEYTPPKTYRTVVDATYMQVNEFYINEFFKDGIAKEILITIKNCLNLNNFDKSDIQTDYFHVGHYTDINIGRWNKPFGLVSA